MKALTVTAFLTLVCVGIAAFVWVMPVYRENRAAHDALRRLENNLREQAEETERLRRELTLLRTDPRAIERVAREKFGLCRADEVIYHFEEQTPAAEPQGAVGTTADTGKAAGAPGQAGRGSEARQ